MIYSLAFLALRPEGTVASSNDSATVSARAPLSGEGLPAIPPSRRDDVVEDIHGVRVSDPYRWLEDPSRPDVQEWMRAQDAATRARLAALPARDALRKRFSELYYVDSIAAPVQRGNQQFILRRKATQEKAVLYWKKGAEDPERVLLDPNTLSTDGSVSLGVWVASYDGKYVAYTLRRNGADSSTLRVRDVATGRDLRVDVISDAKYASPSWTPDSKGFYYTWLPPDPSIASTELPGRAEVRFHRIGTDPRADEVVHPALGDPKRFVGASVSRDGRWLLLSVQRGWTSTDLYFRDLKAAARRPASPVSPTEALGFRRLVVGEDALFEAVAWRGSFYVQTNAGAPRYRVFRVDPRRPEREHWKEIIAESDATLETMQVIGGRLVLGYLRDASSRMEIRDLNGGYVRKVDLPGIGSAEGMVGNPDQDDAYFSFTSFTQAPQVFRTSVRTGDTTLWETTRIPADTTPFTSEQVYYRSKDGTRISMFLVHRKDLARHGENPTLLTGYGGFNVSLTPSFRSSAVVWLEHGGVLAIPNLRGGGEYGEAWHRAGMLANKQNVFDDFIAAARFLIDEKITRPEKLAISGGSNGGLLVGAALVERPDLFRAVICAVPLLDMLRYHKFGSGTTWIEEYGTADDRDQFGWLYAYSPYHRVKDGVAYPAILMMSADSDDRVDPMHARKFVAAIQAATTGRRPVLLRVERNAGHGGADMIREEVEQQADQYAFLLDQMGIAAAY